jgi:capsular polysaccharide biosynthesis protein
MLGIIKKEVDRHVYTHGLIFKKKERNFYSETKKKLQIFNLVL